MDSGLLIGLTTIILFGSWPVPTKTLKINPSVQAFWLTVGHLISGTAIFLLAMQPIAIADFAKPAFAGIIWAIGITCAFVAIKNIGVTRAVGIWVPLIIIASTIWGLFFFGEAKLLGTEKLIRTVVAIGLLLLSAFAIITSGKGEKSVGNVKLGLLAALGVALSSGSFFVPLRLSSLSATSLFLPMGIGTVLFTGALVAIKRLPIKYDLLSTSRMILAGLLVGTGNYTSILTIEKLGVAQGFPLTQMGLIVNTLWGVFLFKEVATKKGLFLIALSIAIAIAGILILNTARP